MKSFFRTKEIEVEGEKLTIRELSAGGHLLLSSSEKEAVGALVCSQCVLEWKDESLESIKENVPARMMNDIVAEVFKLSGIDLAKNSEATPDADSSTS